MSLGKPPFPADCSGLICMRAADYTVLCVWPEGGGGETIVCIYVWSVCKHLSIYIASTYTAWLFWFRRDDRVHVGTS